MCNTFALFFPCNTFVGFSNTFVFAYFSNPQYLIPNVRLIVDGRLVPAIKWGQKCCCTLPMHREDCWKVVYKVYQFNSECPRAWGCRPDSVLGGQELVGQCEQPHSPTSAGRSVAAADQWQLTLCAASRY